MGAVAAPLECATVSSLGWIFDVDGRVFRGASVLVFAIPFACGSPEGDTGLATESSTSTTSTSASSTGSDDGVATSTTSTTSTTSVGDDTGTTSDTTGGEESTVECLVQLDAGNGLVGLHTVTLAPRPGRPPGDGSDDYDPIVVEVDPATGETTEVALGLHGVRAHAFERMRDGGFVVAGDFDGGIFATPSLHRISATGDLVWQAQIDAVGAATDVELVGDEVVAVIGESPVAYAVDDGSELWSAPEFHEHIDQVEADPAGNVYAAGAASSFDGVVLRKYGSDRMLQWEDQDVAKGVALVRFGGLALDVDGSPIVAYATYTAGGVTTAVLRKLTADGDEAWSQTVDIGASRRQLEQIHAIVPRPGGGILGVGRGANGEGLTFAHDGAGTEQWLETFVSPEASGFNAAATTDGTNVYVSWCADEDAPYGDAAWLTYPLAR